MNIPEITSSVLNIYNYIPKYRLASKEQAAENLKKIALPIIGFLGASMICGAQATIQGDCSKMCERFSGWANLVCRLTCMAIPS